jgi:hypothetical protein
VISSHFTSVLTTCAQALLPSRPTSVDVKFLDASSALVSPFWDARPGWKLFVIDPNISRSPTGWAAASPSAPHHLLFGESKQLAAGRGSSEDTRRARDVPAAVVVRGIDRVADAALDFGAEDERVQEIAARHGLHFGESENRGRDGPCRMNHGLQVRVVEVEHVRAHAVHERRRERVQALTPPEDGRLRRAGKWREGGDRAVERFVTCPAERAADPVDDRAAGFFQDGFGNVVGPRLYDVARQPARDVLGRGSRCFGSSRALSGDGGLASP